MILSWSLSLTVGNEQDPYGGPVHFDPPILGDNMNIVLLVFLEEKTYISQFVPSSTVSPNYSVMRPNLLIILSANFFFENRIKCDIPNSKFQIIYICLYRKFLNF